ncbi:MAG: efflux transporter outer membrane subunit [Methylococcales bacterium]|nr:efflux transporter outer membrane subunit [Methylococcales bacterium]
MKKVSLLQFSSFLNSRTTAIVCTIAITTLFSGCALGPDFTRPASPDTKSYTTGKQSNRITTTSSESGAAQTLALGKEIQGQWWTLFRSPPLTKLIEQAMKHSPDLQAALSALTEAQENTSAKQGSLFPALDATASATRQKVSGAQFGNPEGGDSVFTTSTASVKVAYTLDVFGAIRRQIEGFEAQAEYQRFQLEGAFLTLASNVVTTAVQEASLRAQIDATQEIIKAQTRQLDLVKQQFELGGASKIDVLALQSTLEQTRTTLPPLQQQLAQNRHRLTVLAGELPSTVLVAQFKLSDLHLPEELPLSLPSKLVQQRPDVRAQEALLHAASAQIGVATARLFPDFTINANVGSIATRLGDLFVPGSAIWSFGGNLLQPVFHGGELIHKRRAALAAYEQAAAQYRSTVLQAFQNVADTLSALELDAVELKTQDAAVRAALDSLELTRLQYQIGAVSYLALLNSERDYQQVRIGQIEAQATRYADTAALFQALGGGWWNRTNLSTALLTEQKNKQNQ